MNAHNSHNLIKDYSLSKESFICNECGTDFLNRDTLAMHVMETVRDGTCQKAVGKFAKTISSNPDSGTSTPAHICTPNSYSNIEQKAASLCAERLTKKPRDTARLIRGGLAPVLPSCTQSLFKTLINPLALPGWFRLQQASAVDPSVSYTGKDPPWCVNNCLYNNADVLMPVHFPNHLRPDTSMETIDPTRRKTSDRKDFHPDANELRKRRVEKWKESVGRERDMVNLLACKTLAMLNGQTDFKLHDALGRMLSSVDYSKTGMEAISLASQIAGSCNMDSADSVNNISKENKQEMINPNEITLTGSRQPTPTLGSKSDAMSSSWTGDSVLDFKVSDSTDQTKRGHSSSCNSTDSPVEVNCFRHPRSKSTPPRLDGLTMLTTPNKEFNTKNVNSSKSRASFSHSERLHDSGLGSEPGAKLDVEINQDNLRSTSANRSGPRKPGSARSILGKRTCQKSKRLRRSVYLNNHRLACRNVSPLSPVDSTSCCTSVSSSTSPIHAPAQVQAPVVHAQSRASQTAHKSCRTPESMMSSSGAETVPKSGVLLPYYCSHCQIGFGQKTLFSLHMGLHCVDQPWKCNMCGQFCSEVYEFTAHTLHF